VALGAGCALAVVWTFGRHQEPTGPLPAGGAGPSEEARRAERQDRGEWVGRLLAELHPGMAKPEVEAILGPPDRDLDYRYLTGNRRGYAEYLCHPPDRPPGVYVVVMVYDLSGPTARLIRMEGPNRPDGQG
jgi:hypothetical protein